MKRIFLLGILIFYNCNTKFIYKEHPILNQNEKIINSKIGLVGFYDFRSEARVTGKIRRYWSVLDEDKQYFGELESIGKPITSYPVIKNSPLPEGASQFTKIYIDKYGKSSKNELEKLFEFKDDLPRNFKDRNLDFYILANWSPKLALHRRNQYFIGIPQFLTSVAYVATLGTIPAWQTYSVDSEFFVFDKNLNLVDTFKISDRTHFFISWWFEPNDRDSSNIADGEDYNSREISDIAKKKILEYYSTSFKRDYKGFK